MPRARLIRRLYGMRVFTKLTWGVLSLYESITGKVWTLEGDTELIQRDIGPLHCSKISRIIICGIMSLDIERTSISPIRDLGVKKSFYKDHFLCLTEDGFIILPGYMDTHHTASDVPLDRYVHLLTNHGLRQGGTAHIALLQSNVFASYVTWSQR